MKYLKITMFFFLLQVSISVINALAIVDIEYQAQDDWFSSIDDEQLADESYVQGNLDTTSDFGFGDFIKGMWYFVKALGLGIISVPYTLGLFGLRAPFVYYFSVPVYFLYFLAIAQFIANRATKSMD